MHNAAPSSKLTKAEATAAILEAKTPPGLSWEAIAAAAGLFSRCFVTSACLGMNSLPKARRSEKVCDRAGTGVGSQRGVAGVSPQEVGDARANRSGDATGFTR